MTYPTRLPVYQGSDPEAGSVEDYILYWPHEHNWVNRSTERLEWRTRVHRARKGDERRAGLRAQPRMQVSMSHLLEGPAAAQALMDARVWRDRQFAIPLWWAVSGVVDGTQALQYVASGVWCPGRRGALLRANGEVEFFEINGMSSWDSQALSFANGFTYIKRDGDRFVPIVQARLPENQIIAVNTGHVVRVDVTFDVEPGADDTAFLDDTAPVWDQVFPAGSLGLQNHYLGSNENNWVDVVNMEHVGNVNVQDGMVGITSRRLNTLVPTVQWNLKLTMDSARLAKVRRMLVERKGRLRGFLAASPGAEISNVTVDAGVVTVPGLRRLSMPLDQYVGIALLLPTGWVQHSFSSVSGDTAVLGVPLSYPEVLTARLISTVRLLSDTIEYSHVKPGLAEVVIPITTEKFGATGMGFGGGGLTLYIQELWDRPAGVNYIATPPNVGPGTWLIRNPIASINGSYGQGLPIGRLYRSDVAYEANWIGLSIPKPSPTFSTVDLRFVIGKPTSTVGPLLEARVEQTSGDTYYLTVSRNVDDSLDMTFEGFVTRTLHVAAQSEVGFIRVSFDTSGGLHLGYNPGTPTGGYLTDSSTFGPLAPFSPTTLSLKCHIHEAGEGLDTFEVRTA